jgi:hypothetical protein
MEPDQPAQIPIGYITRQSTQIIANSHSDYRADSINTPENTIPYRSHTGTTACWSTRSTGPGHQHHFRGRTVG